MNLDMEYLWRKEAEVSHQREQAWLAAAWCGRWARCSARQAQIQSCVLYSWNHLSWACLFVCSSGKLVTRWELIFPSLEI